MQEMRRQNAGNGYRGELRRFCSIEAEAVPDLRIPVQDHRNYMGGHETTEKMTVLEYLERRKIDGKKRIRLPYWPCSAAWMGGAGSMKSNWQKSELRGTSHAEISECGCC